MKNKYDLCGFVDVFTRQSVQSGIAVRFKKRRREQKLSRKALSVKSDVSYATIRRFEETGEISLSSLLKLAQELNYIEDFNGLFASPVITDLKDYNI